MKEPCLRSIIAASNALGPLSPLAAAANLFPICFAGPLASTALRLRMMAFVSLVIRLLGGSSAFRLGSIESGGLWGEVEIGKRLCQIDLGLLAWSI